MTFSFQIPYNPSMMKVTFSIPLPSSWVCPRGSPPSLCSSKREKPRKVQALEPCYLGLFKLRLYSLLYMGPWASTLRHCASVLGVVWIALSCMLAIILWNQGLNNWVFRNFSSSSADGASITKWFIHLDFCYWMNQLVPPSSGDDFIKFPESTDSPGFLDFVHLVNIR